MKGKHTWGVATATPATAAKIFTQAAENALIDAYALQPGPTENQLPAWRTLM